MKTTETTFERDGLKVGMRATKYVGQMIEYVAEVKLPGEPSSVYTLTPAEVEFVTHATWADKTLSAARCYFGMIV